MTRNLVDGFTGHWPVATEPKYVVDDREKEGDSVILSTANFDKNHVDRFCRTPSWLSSRLDEEAGNPRCARLHHRHSTHTGVGGIVSPPLLASLWSCL